jgi:DNA-binding LacI/PurR family transcriptional regulator
MALGLLQAARRLGRKVPQDLAVVGFDDIPESAYFYPSLTTVQQDLYGLGSMAVHTLIRMLENQPVSASISPSNALFLQPQLIIRDSSILSA